MAVTPPPIQAAETSNVKRTNRPKDNANDPYFATLESFARVTVSGLGGFLVGLSLARRGSGGGAAARQATSAFAKIPRGAKGEQRSIAKNSKAVEKDNAKARGAAASKNNHDSSGGKRLRRQRVIRTTPPSTGPYVDQELPYTWAIAVSSFVGIIEFTRITSPTSFIWELTRGASKTSGNNLPMNDNEMDSRNESEGNSFFENISFNPSIATISDFVIGGSVAGALFRGSAVRTRVGARMDASIMGTPSSYSSAVKGKPLSGLLPGAALGLLAGVVTVAVEHAQVAVEDYFGDDSEDEHEMVAIGNEDAVPIPSDIKAMSNEELMESIESLKRGKRESEGDNADDAQITEEISKQSSQTKFLLSPEEQKAEIESTEKAKKRGWLSSLGFRRHAPQ